MNNMSRRLTSVLAASAIVMTVGVAAAAPTHADTRTVTKVEKALFLNEVLLKKQSPDCVVVTMSDKFKNWAVITPNLDVPPHLNCYPFSGQIWYKKTADEGWTFVDSGQSDLIVGVPAAVEREFEVSL